MVTKYDVFEIVYKNRASLKPIEVVRRLYKDEREYHVIHRSLRELVKEKLLIISCNGTRSKVWHGTFSNIPSTLQ